MAIMWRVPSKFKIFILQGPILSGMSHKKKIET
jgi:hypothetical protein